MQFICDSLTIDRSLPSWCSKWFAICRNWSQNRLSNLAFPNFPQLISSTKFNVSTHWNQHMKLFQIWNGIFLIYVFVSVSVFPLLPFHIHTHTHAHKCIFCWVWYIVAQKFTSNVLKYFFRLFACSLANEMYVASKRAAKITIQNSHVR